MGCIILCHQCEWAYYLGNKIVMIDGLQLHFPDHRMEKHGWSEISWSLIPNTGPSSAKSKSIPTFGACLVTNRVISLKRSYARWAKRLATLLPGDPRAEDYGLGRFSPYKLHQRCVPRMRVGRVLLAVDTAHLNTRCRPLCSTAGSLLTAQQG